MNKFWRFENKVSSEGSSTLYLDGDISSVTWWGDEVTPEEFRNELRQMKGDLTVHINSQGGDVFAGVTIYNALRDYGRGKVIVKVDGIAASIASVVAMAGDEIIMSPGSMMMVHNPWTMGVGSADELRKTADALDEIKDAILPIYVDRSGQSQETVKELMDNETWMTAEKAVELGFADTVQKAKVETPKEGASEDKITNLMMANFAFSMSATKSAMKDLIKKVNSERETQMNEDELKKTEAEVETTEAEVKEPQEKVETEVKDECEGTCEKGAESEEKTEEKTEDQNAEEGEKAEDEEKTEESEEDIADKVEAKIKALQDENASLKAEIEALKDAKASAEAKASAQDELQARLTAVLSMAETADGGDVAGGKEDKKSVDTYGTALADAFKELS